MLDSTSNIAECFRYFFFVYEWWGILQVSRTSLTLESNCYSSTFCNRIYNFVFQNRPKNSKSKRPKEISLSGSNKPMSGRRVHGSSSSSPASTPTPTSEGVNATKARQGKNMRGSTYGGRTGLKSPAGVTSSKRKEVDDLMIPGGRAGLRKWKTTPLSSPVEEHVQALKKLELEVAAENAKQMNGEASSEDKENSSQAGAKSRSKSTTKTSPRPTTAQKSQTSKRAGQSNSHLKTTKSSTLSKTSERSSIPKLPRSQSQTKTAESRKGKESQTGDKRLAGSTAKSRQTFKGVKMADRPKSTKDDQSKKQFPKSKSDTGHNKVSASSVNGSMSRAKEMKSLRDAPSPVSKQKVNLLVSVTLAQEAKKGMIENGYEDIFDLKCLNGSRASLADDDEVSECSHIAVRGSSSPPPDLSPCDSDYTIDVFEGNAEQNTSELNQLANTSTKPAQLPESEIFTVGPLVPNLVITFVIPE